MRYLPPYYLPPTFADKIADLDTWINLLIHEAGSLRGPLQCRAPE